jgi:myo-inositol-1(or 4)-monophosphatase
MKELISLLTGIAAITGYHKDIHMKTKILLTTAMKAAREAARIHMKYFNKKIDVSYKSGYYDLVTRADVEAEERIVAVIKEKFPRHNILAEEKKYAETDSEFRWVIDPLDGTNNYAHSLPIFSVSIGVAKAGEVICGVIYDPTRNELFHAERGNGAFLNGKRINVSDASTLHEAIFCTGFYYNRGKPMQDTLKAINQFFQAGIVGIRRLGSAALDLCNLACGRIDGFWEYLLSPWDYTAGMLIVEEGGGKLTNYAGNKPGIAPSSIVASNGKLHEIMLSILK